MRGAAHHIQVEISSRSRDPCRMSRTEEALPSDATPSRPFFEPVAHKIGLAALGVGVVGLGVGTGFALHARSKNESSEAAGCSDRNCPNASSLALRRDAVSAGNWATVAAGVGLASLAAAGILFWVVPESSAPEPIARVVPRVETNSAGIDVYGAF